MDEETDTVKKRLSLLLSLVLIVVLVAACGNNANTGTNSGNTNAGNNAGGNATDKKDMKIALVLPEEIGVNPFFELMDQGFKDAGEEFGVQVKTVESSDANAFEQNFRSVVAEGYDLVITATFQAEDALRKIAAENPELPIAIIDQVIPDVPNVRSVAFVENEASFLLGAAAGLITETNTVGNIVAIEGALMDKYTKGFEKGLKYTNPDAKVLVSYVGGFADSPKAKELALHQNSQGADFIAGMSAVGDFGVFEAAKEKGFYASGQDVDRTVIDPEHVILSQLKGVDTVAYETVKEFVNGTFEYGSYYYGLAQDGVGLTFVTRDSESPLSEAIGEENLAKLKEIAEGIKDGSIDASIPTE